MIKAAEINKRAKECRQHTSFDYYCQKIEHTIIDCANIGQFEITYPIWCLNEDETKALLRLLLNDDYKVGINEEQQLIQISWKDVISSQNSNN